MQISVVSRSGDTACLFSLCESRIHLSLPMVRGFFFGLIGMMVALSVSEMLGVFWTQFLKILQKEQMSVYLRNKS